ncbi:nuclear transport factor 2 family protein [Rhodococcus erythropolis]|uniref:Nuclear transport factor 2 family protein n=1 Tax=Rhodococcus erythropolis TaxID=1833 RepID=A0A8I0ZTE4_RHOER|nr:nuclear transport factor 2 family protein [Rhodococcus erythropolis]MBH5141999.1 nuclear transport factor 2 family protein [Rhodococcus erythropolis]MBH5145367.1 nuclear transport factor 2 family protein [Rhodococcus erythropolis]MBH5145393.1 nuclear transport factor 2 family protein [Rhodococcus erythropolis]
MNSRNPQKVVSDFLDDFAGRDIDGAIGNTAEDINVNVYGLGHHDIGRGTIRTVLADIVEAFPDLIVTVKRIITAGNVVTAEINVQGTQAAPYAGAINQEKHIDLDEVWRFVVAEDRITQIDAYWCQQQLYRRLGVKRFDQIAIV